MNELFEGLTNKFNETSGDPASHNSCYTLVNGRLYSVEMQNPTYPFIHMSLITDTNTINFTSDFEECIVQFNIYSESRSPLESGNIFNALKALFDRSKPVVSGYSTVSMKREVSRPTRFPEENVWQYSVRYRVTLRK
jgi:hypothetical protein